MIPIKDNYKNSVRTQLSNPSTQMLKTGTPILHKTQILPIQLTWNPKLINSQHDCIFNPKYEQHFEKKKRRKINKTFWPSDEVYFQRIQYLSKWYTWKLSTSNTTLEH